MYQMICDPGIESYPFRVALTLRISGWGLVNMRGGIDPGHHRFCLRFVGVVDVLKGL